MMFSRRFVPYIIAICAVVFLSVSYVGYRVYHDHVEFEAFLSKAQALHSSLDEDASYTEGRDVQSASDKSPASNRVPAPTSFPVKVKLHDLGPEGDVISGDSSIPDKTWMAEEMVRQSIELPNGVVHEIAVIPGMEIREGERISSERLDALIASRITHTEINGVMYDVPIDVDPDVYSQKLLWADDLDVPLETVERMIANRELIVKPNGVPLTLEEKRINFNLTRKIPKFAHLIPDMIAAHPELLDNVAPPDGVSTPISPRSGEKSESAEVAVSDDFDGRFDVEVENPVEAASIRKSAVEGAPKTLELPTVESLETQLRERLSPERREKAQQFFKQYGPEEGLRRLKEADPDAARQFEHEQKVPPARAEPETR